jgi:hypothetical protein
MRKNLGLSWIASAILFFGTTTASGLTLWTELNFANSSFANPGVLTAGDVIVVDTRASNPDQDIFKTMFVSLVYDASELQYVGAELFDILVEDSCPGFCTPARLGPIVGGGQLEKPNDPASLGTGTEAWVNGFVHTNIDGASGLGGEVATRMTLQVLSNLTSVTIAMALTPGDTITDENLMEFAGPLSLNGIVITPEPGTAVLLGLGLICLGHRSQRRGSSTGGC